MKLNISPIPALSDNYIWCLSIADKAVVVDPGESAPVLAYLKQNNLKLDAIIVTHRHHDHINGIPELTNAFPDIKVHGPETPRITTITDPVWDGDTVSLFDDQLLLSVIEVPGHTLDHVAYFNEAYLFCGDTLFSAGCGRMFEGNPEQFWQSLKKLSSLGEDIKVYCTHEYTQANLKFAEYLEPDNLDIKTHIRWVNEKRQLNLPSLPSTISKERQINPFLRCHLPEFVESIKKILNINNHNATAVFAAVRAAKDNF
ncbi:hydroxyacylglutathione hydrolase [Agaribacter flavus]|uniref:Hydroxyacylglutathione hydrolase n=1 Tax=Agaribacter flavus TaxID=1902781 RepID=A0ABV7FLJ2_9ALTE